MRAVVAKLLQKLGLAQPAVARPAGQEGRAPHTQPQVEPGSTLDAMAALNPASVASYTDAVLGEIGRCIERCSIAAPGADESEILEQIHALKNALAPTGSPELLKACEQLRKDTCHGVDRVMIERRYKAVANAAAKLVRNFGETTTKGQGD